VPASVSINEKQLGYATGSKKSLSLGIPEIGPEPNPMMQAISKSPKIRPITRSIVENEMSDWKDRLQRLVDELDCLKEQFGCYYEHAIVQIDLSVELAAFDAVTPGVSKNYLTCNKVAKSLDLAVPGVGVHRHYFFSTDRSASDLDRFSAILEKHSGAVSRMPKSVVSKIKLPPNTFSRSDEILVSWMYLLHRVARDGWNRIYSREIQFLESAAEAADSQFRDWGESITLESFSPTEFLDLRQHGEEYEKQKAAHTSAGKIVPQLISSALTKPLLYASINVLGHLSEADQDNSSHAPRAVKEQFSKSRMKVVAALMNHHGLGKKRPLFRPLTEEELGQLSGTSQSTAHRTLEQMQELVAKIKGARIKQSPSDWYEHECNSNTILEVLEYIETPPRMREILKESLDHLKDLKSDDPRG